MSRDQDLKKAVKHWEKTRKQGKMRYALKWALIFGALIPIVVGLVDLYDQEFEDVFLKWGFLRDLAMWFLIVFVLCYVIVWRINETMYQKGKEELGSK
jgi:cell division protein FtsW (lipid II flippase)